VRVLDDSLPLGRTILVIGGARSGKSALAERIVMREPSPWIYVATATASDEEMRERIARHRERRSAGWHTVEEPSEVAGTLLRAGRPVLVDCLTLWISNLLEAGRDAEAEAQDLIELLPALERTTVLVSNETGLGIVPDNALARTFRDVAGRVNQRLAAAADSVVFTVAGIPLVLKSPEKV
jgi:adenosylcobinamide kinase/adenosylcobinamide-phosphate guanylyltransferase